MTRSSFLFPRSFGLDAAVLAVTASVLASAALPQPGSPEAALDVFERQLSAASGQVIPLALSGTDHKVVFYAPFSILWLLDETGSAVAATARLTRTRNQLYLDLGDTVQLVDLTAPGTSTTGSATGTMAQAARHPIALFHDRLLAQPLARPVAGLAAGSRFLAWNSTNGGIVQPPQSDAAQITGPVLWRSLGDHIVIQHGTGPAAPIPWHEIDAALKGRDG